MDLDLTTMLDDYRAWLVGQGRRPRGVQSYTGEVRRFLAWLGERPMLSDLTRGRITRYRDARAAERAAATIHAELCVIRSFCRFLVERELLASDPTSGIAFPTPRPPAPRPVSRELLRTMLEAIEVPRLTGEHAHTWARNRLGVLVFLYTGMRLSEVAALRWRDVELERGTIVVRDGKNGKSRAVPIHPRLAVELGAVAGRAPDHAVIPGPGGRAMHPKSVAEICTRWLAARGVRLTPHQLRHTFATEMLRAGAKLPDIQHALGHASLETTQMYLLVDAEHLRQAVELLPDAW
jgi:site-specific recombinase XerD